MSSSFTVQAFDAKVKVASFECEPDEFILDAAERAGVELPYSCRNGGCLRCCAKIISGNIKMEEQYVLEEEDTDKGFFLPCCTTAVSGLSFQIDQESELDNQ